jgi:hypothetical protein
MPDLPDPTGYVDCRVDVLRIGLAPSGHRTPLVSLKAVPIFCGLDGKPERDFAGAVENLKQMVADKTTKLALLSLCR